MYALLIPKKKLSHKGILILGGLSVDPLYKGKLLVGLYNFSSQEFPIISGKKLLAAQFYRLEEDEIGEFSAPSAPIMEFPDDLVSMMRNYKPVSNQSLQSDFKRMEAQFSMLQKDFEDKDVWFEKFQDKLDRQERNVEAILVTLREEVEDRKQEDRDIEEKIDKTTDNINTLSQSVSQQTGQLKMLTRFFFGTLIALAVGAGVAFITEMLK
ncbi:MAG: hypothetical protein M3Q97_08440 [Bacteroidota bacterium]|nr:hypothetical protein [Bacteroidota bacterium]